jgi:vacuolar-type H+-ATPase subunit H
MTSIEWLRIQLEVRGNTHDIIIDIEELDELIQQAKEMHKQEIENAYWEGGQNIPMSEKSCEQYYQETFKKHII